MIKRSKKGFTLIEMMAVIAIVAVLIAVIVPVMTGKTDKAAAATNAANLRGVEGELVAMMLINPKAFGDKLDTQLDWEAEKDFRENEGAEGLDAALAALETAEANRDANIQRMAELSKTVAEYSAKLEEIDVAGYEAAYNSAKATCQGATDCSGNVSHATDCDCSKAYGKYLLAVAAHEGAAPMLESAATELANEERNKEVYQKAVDDAQAEVNRLIEENGLRIDELGTLLDNLYRYEVVDDYITLEDGTKVHCPPAQKVKIDDVDCAKGTPMYVYVNPNDLNGQPFIATYADYNKNDFARVADEANAS